MAKRRAKRQMFDRWIEKYGVGLSTLHHLEPHEVEQLMRMKEHARATIFSSIKWDRAHPYWKASKIVSTRKRARQMRDEEIERMLLLASRRRAA